MHAFAASALPSFKTRLAHCWSWFMSVTALPVREEVTEERALSSWEVRLVPIEERSELAPALRVEEVRF